ncbi:hypothetical protein RRG08_027591 [Elysia crispata]|uniref:Uncharacterized protein n=1 Tax=Elysia crispata TaxID=231223 RepID=A0AAE1AEV1_9GAST|nr:hypothetical protein RRG08_027591 [Elysia crispata]
MDLEVISSCGAALTFEWSWISYHETLVHGSMRIEMFRGFSDGLYSKVSGLEWSSSSGCSDQLKQSGSLFKEGVKTMGRGSSPEFNNGRTIRSQHLIGKEEALVSLDLPCLLFRHQGQSAARRPCSRAKSTRLLFTLPITTPPLFLSPRPDFVSCLTPLVAKDAHGYRKSPEDTI